MLISMDARSIIERLQSIQSEKSIRLPIIVNDTMPRDVFLKQLSHELQRIKPSYIILDHLYAADVSVKTLSEILAFFQKAGIKKIYFDCDKLNIISANLFLNALKQAYDAQLFSFSFQCPNVLEKKTDLYDYFQDALQKITHQTHSGYFSFFKTPTPQQNTSYLDPIMKLINGMLGR